MTDNLHPTFSSANIDKRLYQSIEVGDELVVVKGMKRNGVRYENGDLISGVGSLKNDDKLARQGYFWTQAAYDGYYAMRKSEKYQREVVTPLQQAYNRAITDLSKAKAALSIVQADIRQKRAVVSAAKKHVKETGEALEVAQADAPPQL